MRFSGRLRILFFCGFAGAETSALGILCIRFLPLFQEKHLSFVPLPAGLAMIYAANSLQIESVRALRICLSCKSMNEQVCVCAFSDFETAGLDPEISKENVREWLIPNNDSPWDPLEFLYMDPFPVDTIRRIPSSSGSISSKDEEREGTKSISSSNMSDDSRSRSS
jgi:hypothetical protein